MTTKITADDLARFAPKAQMRLVDDLAAMLKVSRETAVAIRLCQQTLNEWCSTPTERGAVIAALFGIENQRRTLSDES